MKKLFSATLLMATATTMFAQDRKDAANYSVPPKNEFYEKIKKENSDFFKEKKPEAKRLTMDFSNVTLPKGLNDFTIVTTDKPVSQGITGTCWCFSTTSFYESEAARLGKGEMQFSEIYTVYYEYVEKAKEFVRTRGESIFDEGSETNAVQRNLKKYGLVPANAYTGMKNGQPFHDHSKMVGEMRKYLQSVKTTNAWNKDEVVATVKAIMNHYLGEPPTSVTVKGKQMTPKEYLQTTGIVPDDYVTFMSFKSEPYWTNAEYKVDDNWWHSDDYYNLPLDDFMSTIKKALKNGYSISIGGDVSESGIDSKRGIMMVPSYDIPSSYINEDARLLRFVNGATTDDHAMHIIGYSEQPNGMWLLVKDSGAGGHANSEHSGYWYMHEDYIKLKMTTATMHKSAAKDVLSKFK